MSLQSAIEAYKRRASENQVALDGEDVLLRLSQSRNAADAVAAMTDDPDCESRIIQACLECDLVCRQFYEDVRAEKDYWGPKLDALTAGVADLEGFVDEVASGPKHQLSAYIALEPGEAQSLQSALFRLRQLIADRKRIAAETPVRLGATKKVAGGDETAALGWLAEGVERITGRPHYQHVARLGEVILRSAKDISSDRVREALRTRREKGWRQPIGSFSTN